MVSEYDGDDISPWDEWLLGHDVSFEDGSWLSDHKDEVPQEAQEYFLGIRKGNQEALEQQDDLLNKIGLLPETGQLVPIYGHWKSKDGVHVRIDSAIINQYGAIKNCAALAKQPDHSLWLPSFAAGGYEDRHIQKTAFEPFAWAPETYPLGIDEGDGLATRYAKARPRLGKKLTKVLDLTNDQKLKDWHCQDGQLALSSQVWGGWEPDSDQHQHRTQNEGVILRASTKWLDQFLSENKQCLVYHITFHKYKSRRNDEDSSKVRAVYVGL